MTQIKKETARY